MVDEKLWIHRTYCQLVRRIMAMVQMMKELPPARLAIGCGIHVSTLEMVIAAMTAGWEFVLVDLLRKPLEHQLYKLADSQSHVLVIPSMDEMPDALIDQVNLLRQQSPAPAIWSVGQNPLSDVNLLEKMTENTGAGHFEPANQKWLEPTGLLYSSGRHGQPRGFFFTTQALCANIHSLIQWLKLTPGTRFLLGMELDSCDGLMPALASIYAGGTTILHPKVQSGNFWSIISQSDADLVRAKPSLIEEILETNRRINNINRSNLKYVICETFDLPLLQCYGTAETGGYVLGMPPDLSWREYELALRDNIVGGELSLCNVQLQRNLEGVTAVPMAENEGLLSVRGYALSCGQWMGDHIEYWQDAWLPTTDMAVNISETEENCYQIRGRMEDTLVVNNQRFWPACIERTLLDTFTFLQDCVVLALPDVNGKNVLHAVVIMSGGIPSHRRSELMALMEARLKANGVSGLSTEVVPQFIIPLEEHEMPRRYDGQPDRHQLFQVITQHMADQGIAAS
jgi:acyl-CoA synthetase (AMP-forming)/AMP-acid ligase II